MNSSEVIQVVRMDDNDKIIFLRHYFNASASTRTIRKLSGGVFVFLWSLFKLSQAIKLMLRSSVVSWGTADYDQIIFIRTPTKESEREFWCLSIRKRSLFWLWLRLQLYAHCNFQKKIAILDSTSEKEKLGGETLLDSIICSKRLQSTLFFGSIKLILIKSYWKNLFYSLISIFR